MARPNQFWQAVESLPGLAAVEAEWRQLVGDEFGLIAPLLRPRQERAESYPPPEGCILPLDVVEHGCNDFVGVCRETGLTLPLSGSQLVVYELDRMRLGCRVAEAFGLGGAGVEDAGDLTLSLGSFTAASQPTIQAFLAFPRDGEHLHAVAAKLIAEWHAPFVLLAPTCRQLRRAVASYLQGRRCTFISLADVLTIRAGGRFVAVESLGSLVARASDAETGAVRARDGGKNLFRYENDQWALRFAGRPGCVEDSLGMKCIGHLLYRQSVPVDVCLLRDLAYSEVPLRPLKGIEIADGQAVLEYKSAIDDLKSQLATAEKNNDLGKAESLQTAIEDVNNQVAAATGLGGRLRQTRGGRANARTSVTNAIGRAIEQIGRKLPDLSRHLDRAIRTGAECCYAPDSPVEWDF